MNKTFLNHDKSLLTVMLQCETPETAIGRIRNASHCGAEGFGLQVESLKPEFHNQETYKKLFDEMVSASKEGVETYCKNLNGWRKTHVRCSSVRE